MRNHIGLKITVCIVRIMSNLIISSEKFHKVSQKLREFFLKKGFIEAHTQNRLSILAACEDPGTVATYNYRHPDTGKTEVWPLPQTGQMWLEYELLTNPSPPGYFCMSTSYRNEPHPKEGRHLTIFPLFEFEMKGGMADLARMETELLEFLGYKNVARCEYDDVASRYSVKELENEHEEMMYRDDGPAALLCNFPNYTSPFWNMRQHESGTHAYKIDVICSGQETIGSAERSSDPAEMRRMFDEISDGGYKQLLYDKFGKDRVEKEMKEFLSHKFMPRSGGGIGVTRLMRSMELEGLI